MIDLKLIESNIKFFFMMLTIKCIIQLYSGEELISSFK